MFIIDDWIVGFVKGFVRSMFGRHEDGHHTWFGDGWGSANRHASNSIKIWGGLFKTDPNRDDPGKQILSRIFWQNPHTTTGFLASHLANTYGQVQDIDYYGGATVLRMRKDGYAAITIGNYIIGRNKIEASPDNETFQHEYGHYLQSQGSGPLYLFRYGIPSLASTIVNSYEDHMKTKVEQDANILALRYFMTNETDFDYVHDWYWQEDENPIIGIKWPWRYSHDEMIKFLDEKIYGFKRFIFFYPYWITEIIIFLFL